MVGRSAGRTCVRQESKVSALRNCQHGWLACLRESNRRVRFAWFHPRLAHPSQLLLVEPARKSPHLQRRAHLLHTLVVRVLRRRAPIMREERVPTTSPPVLSHGLQRFLAIGQMVREEALVFAQSSARTTKHHAREKKDGHSTSAYCDHDDDRQGNGAAPAAPANAMCRDRLQT